MLNRPKQHIAAEQAPIRMLVETKYAEPLKQERSTALAASEAVIPASRIPIGIIAATDSG
jgi:hypothetical protein